MVADRTNAPSPASAEPVVNQSCGKCGFKLRAQPAGEKCPGCGSADIESAPRSGKARLLDVEWTPPPEPRFRFWFIILGVVLGTPVALILLFVIIAALNSLGWSSWPRWSGRAIFGAVVAAGAGYFYWRRRRANRMLAETLRASFAADGGDALRTVELVRPFLKSLHYQPLVSLSFRLAANGNAGVAMRLGPRKFLTGVDPVVVPFDAIPFDQFDERFESLIAPDATGRPHFFEKLLTRDDRSETKRTLRWWSYQGRWIVLIFAGLGAGAAVLILRSGTVSFWPAYYLAFAVLLGFKLRRDAKLRSQRLFFIPGGLIRRKPRETGWDVDVFSRRDGALVLLRPTEEMIYWAIANRTGKWVSYHAAPREAEMLLRCWLSPIEPPDVERLSDLA